ncbi:MAG: hypothetical protein WCK26_03070 [Candidatus Saccharibacteria bacterium]
MKKTYIIIAISVAILFFGGIAYFVSQSNNSDKSSITPDHYYVEKNMEQFAKTTKPAVENFVSQDSSESAKARKTRLKKYFTDDSVVYDYGLNNISPSINKTIAKLTSVISFGDKDGIFAVQAMVNVQLFSDKKFLASNIQTYIVSFKKNSKGGFDKPYDIKEQL